MAPAVATLTYVYADSTAVLGPLAIDVVPGSYDLCAVHAEKMSVPRGWDVIRLPQEDPAVTQQEADDDLMALANAVRQIGLRDEPSIPPAPQHRPPSGEGAPRLRVIRD